MIPSCLSRYAWGSTERLAFELRGLRLQVMGALRRVRLKRLSDTLSSRQPLSSLMSSPHSGNARECERHRREQPNYHQLRSQEVAPGQETDGQHDGSPSHNGDPDDTGGLARPSDDRDCPKTPDKSNDEPRRRNREVGVEHADGVRPTQLRQDEKQPPENHRSDSQRDRKSTRLNS